MPAAYEIRFAYEMCFAHEGTNFISLCGIAAKILNGEAVISHRAERDISPAKPAAASPPVSCGTDDERRGRAMLAPTAGKRKAEKIRVIRNELRPRSVPSSLSPAVMISSYKGTLISALKTGGQR